MSNNSRGLRMKYNFDEIINRKDTNSVKYDVGDDILPMWIADMDFKVCPKVLQAIQKRLDNGILGYSTINHYFYKYKFRGRTKYHF